MNDDGTLKFKVIENEEDKVDESLSHISLSIKHDGSFKLIEERGFKEVYSNKNNLEELISHLREVLGDRR